MNKSVVILFLTFLFVQAGIAQNPFIKNYTIRNGLPTNRIYCVIKDDEGFLWFGSDVGVIRFDGSNFVNYNSNDGLSDNIVLRIKQDLEGRIWFFNRNGTVNYFYKNLIFNDQNTPFLKNLETTFLFHDFYQDADSVIYFYNSKSELFVIKDNSYIDYTCLEDSRFSQERELFYINKNDSGNFQLWANSGLYELKCIDDEITVHEYSESIVKAFRKSNNETYGVGRDGSLHLFKNGKLIKKQAIKLESFMVNSILADNEGLTWVSVFDKGLFCYKKDSVIFQLDIKYAQNLILDDENNIWTTSNRNGIYKINRDILKYKFLGKELFNDVGITGLARAKQNGIWAINSKNFYFIDDQRIIGSNYNFKGQLFDNIYHLKNNSLLLTGYKNELHVLKDVNLNFQNNTIEDSGSFKENARTKKIAIDSSEACIYSFINDDLIKLDLIPAPKVDYMTFSGKLGRINNLFVNNKNQIVINADKNYNVIGKKVYYDRNLWRFGGEFISSHTIIDNHNELYHMVGDDIYLVNDSDFYHVLGESMSQVDYRIKDMIYVDSTLYFFTIKSVYFVSHPLHVVEGQPIVLNRLNIEFNNINAIYFEENTLHVATDDGLAFIPVTDYITASNKLTKPFINHVTLDDESVDFSEGHIEYKNKSRLSIDFSSLNFSSIPSNYSYKLEGVDENWIFGNENRVVYLNLEPGNYSFKLKSRKNQEEYSEPVELPIIVHPTIYQRTITKIATIVLVLFILFLIVRDFYQRQIRHKETENTLITLEHRALQSMMNPHFIFNSLGSIQRFLLQNKAEEAASYLSQFARLIRQNMNSLKSNQISLDDEVERLRNYIELEKFRMDHKFEYSIEIDSELDDDEFYIPSMIVQPYVENAIWHGISSLYEKGVIAVKFKYKSDKCVFIQIEDNGIGFVKSQAFSKSKNNLNMASTLTRKRLELIGEQYKIESSVTREDLNPLLQNPGTRITLVVPFVG